MAILTALTVLTYWANQRIDEADDSNARDIDTQLNYALTNFELRYYDETGRQALVLTSPRFASDATTGEGTATQAEVEIRHQGFVWNIMADTARIPAERQRVLLDGPVRMVRLGDREADWVQIDSSDITLEVEQRIAHSGRSVSAQNLAGQMQATGFIVNMADNTFQFEQNVEGVYVIP